jgi:hypothetical protein
VKIKSRENFREFLRFFLEGLHHFLSMEDLCGFNKMLKNVGIIRDQTGQLEDLENTGWEGG